ncbi:Pentatricopeptide repeat-containing protein [Auxenochlorella protothecoides]|uniref:Pentatricopeptide repeat-containing protein n=1 Tax=Auxenochlorella protothecoides TaxID=3075 RepID=A0A087SJT2_AUXPR|nr:Pentatricopeptide repeat-containing protein [Auxenochlorella protothecoides]KFM25986.1 Pentatricopeptide repeat-containing protein [Auxenochlorella protothecoides]
MLAAHPADAPPPPKEELLRRWAQRDIYFLKTHVGMAAQARRVSLPIQAFLMGLLDAAALHRIAKTAQTDFVRIWGRYGGRTAGRNLPRAMKRLNADIARVNRLLPEKLCSSGQLDAACRLAEEACAGANPPSYTNLQHVLNATLQAHSPFLAVRILRAMSRAGYAPNKVTYCALIAALGREGPRGGEGSVQAFELWKELEARNVELDAAAIRTGMKACVGVGDLPAAEALLSGLLSGAHPAPPDARAFNIVLSGHARAGDVEGMERTLRALCAADVPASDVTYNTLVDGYARAGRPAAARDVLASAAAAGRRLGARPHASLVHAAAAAGDAPALGAALEAMAVGGLPRDAMTWGALVGGAAARGDLATARADLREMLAAGHAPSHALFNGLLGACGVARSPGAAREVLADMRRAGLEPRRDAYLALASGLARVGMWHAVLDTWSEQHRRGVAPDVRMHTLLTQAYGRMLDTLATLCVRTGEFRMGMQALRALERMGVEATLVPACICAPPYMLRFQALCTLARRFS